ncbi:hypothetical protein HHI36_003458 [Cryptolaemus montrouzieri]|uniref:Solute carrier family 46 member 3 n=1 Tax=Cryptolaemus montrouzieri TaxID=559131 RepID=A0ABD2PE80_9CUCU
MSQTDLAKNLNIEFQSKSTDKKSLCQKFNYVITHITVEPTIFLYTLSVMMNYIVTQNLSLEKACRVNLHFNESICDAMVVRNRSGYLPHQEVEVQQLVVKWAAYRGFIIGSIPIVTMIFLGSWSDRHRRRKPLILLPMFGDLLDSIGLFICSYFFLELSLEYSWSFDTFCIALCGGQCIMYLGIYSYVGGIGSNEDKTLRIGSVSISDTVAVSISMFLGGIILNRLGFLGSYSITTFLLTIGILYTTFNIKENKMENEEKKKIGFLKDIFALEHVKNTFKICFRKREGNTRTQILVVIFLGMMLLGPLQGEITVQYMYLRLKFGWDEVDFSVFNALHFSMQIIGNIFALSFLANYLKWNDAILGIAGMISKVSASILYALAPSGIYFYIGAIVEMFNAVPIVAMRAIMAKIVPTYELGQCNSIFGICDVLTFFIFGPLYSKIYIKTITVFPGTFYLLSAGLYMVGFCSFLYLYKSGQKETKPKNPLETKNISCEVSEKSVEDC